jgi:hypothetical protein
MFFILQKVSIKQREYRPTLLSCDTPSYLTHNTHHGAGLFILWHAPRIAQFAQPQPQDVFPFLLSRTSFPAARKAHPATIKSTSIVPAFATIHEIIFPTYNPIIRDDAWIISLSTGSPVSSTHSLI